MRPAQHRHQYRHRSSAFLIFLSVAGIWATACVQPAALDFDSNKSNGGDGVGGLGSGGRGSGANGEGASLTGGGGAPPIGCAEVENCATPEDDDCDGKSLDIEDGCQCAPGQTQSCYDGEESTRGVGLCADGTQLCLTNGKGWAECLGERLPEADEDCSWVGDEDCNAVENDCDDCVQQSVPVTLRVPAFLFVVDASERVADSEDLWDSLIDRSVDIVEDNDWSGVSIGWTSSPRVDNPTAACDAASYANLAVPFAAAEGQSSAIGDFGAMHDPQGDPAWSLALAGARKSAQAFNLAHGGEVPSIVLVVKSGPTGCNDSWAALGAEAAASLAQGIKVHVLTLKGANTSNWDTVASVGGTGSSLNLGGDFAGALGVRMAQVRVASARCDFFLPAATRAGSVDPLTVGVQQTVIGDITTNLERIADESACSLANFGRGWYFTDNANPKLGQLCDSGGAVPACRLATNGVETIMNYGCDY